MKITAVIIAEKPINIDPQVLFQCLIAIKNHHEYLSELFEYKRCSHPPALFDRYRLPRESQKPQTTDAAWEATKCGQNKNSK